MRPLEDILILDFSRALAGPYCTMQLADLGARVVKIEQPGRGDDTRAWGPPFLGGESAYFLSVNRNKESLALDLKHPAARPIIEALLRRADALVENFRPGTMARLGLGYHDIAPRFPRLVYCSISGFGHSGPRSREPGYDAVIQAEGGLMSVTGAADGPPYRMGVAIADMATGLLASQGILAALLARQRTGRGQHLDLAMLDAVASLLTYQAALVFATGSSPGRIGNRHPTIAPYDTFTAADGDFVLAVGNDDQFNRLCSLLRREDLAEDARFATNPARVEHYDALRQQLAAAFSPRRRDELVRALTEAGVPCGAVRTVAETLGDPQLAAREMIVSLQHAAAGPIRVLGNPLKLSETAPSVETPPPLLGEHTSRILTEDAGLSGEEIRALERAGAVATRTSPTDRPSRV